MAHQKDVEAIMETGDEHSVIIRFHALWDDGLTLLISERLVAPHEVEVSRLSFGLKCDLAVALGVLNPRTRGVFAVLGRIRNRLAHVHGEKISSQDAFDLLNALDAQLADGVREIEGPDASPAVIVKSVGYLMYKRLSSTLERLRDEKLYNEVALEDMKEFLAGLRVSPDWAKERERMLQEKLEKKRRNGHSNKKNAV